MHSKNKLCKCYTTALKRNSRELDLNLLVLPLGFTSTTLKLPYPSSAHYEFMI